MRAQVAFSRDFMEAYSRLQKAQQKKVREFTEKFQRDPNRPGINFERIEGAVDDKVRSVRIDRAYRAIVVHPPRDDVFLCVWVARHDDAYRWVRNKRFEVNPKSGVFQLYGLVEPPAAAAEPEAAAEVEAPARDLLADYDDEDLLFAGVPAPLLAAVRALRSEEELDALAPHVPAEAAEMLYLFAAGYDLLDALEELERSAKAPETVDTQDFGTALARDDSRRTFRIVDDEQELEEMLDAPFEQWRIFLHPTQRKLVEMNGNGPIRALGGAGTGKTVALMHRAKHLARKVFDGPDDRLLVTTYTRNLALDLKTNLRNLCAEEMSRLEVVNLHSWAVGFMRRHGHTFRIASDKERRRQMEVAVEESPTDDFSVDLLADEWNHVVQDQEIDSRDGYLTARRVGRGVRLGRLQKARIWTIFERYRELLSQRGWVEWPDVIRETRLYIENQGISSPYCAVLADEVQDFTATALRLLRALAPQAPNTLFVVGDAHQRIYGHPICLGHCGIEIRGRSRRLKVNYRTTAEIHRHAVAILEGCTIDDLDGEADTLRGYCSLRRGPEPELRHFLKEAQEASFLVEQVKEWLGEEVPESAICVAARTRSKITDRYRPILEAAGIRTVMVEKDPESEARKPGVRLATMHRLKGLEFPRVILAGVQEGTLPLPPSYDSADQASAEDHLLQERCLFYVASTRARDQLVITGYGSPSPFLS